MEAIRERARVRGVTKALDDVSQGFTPSIGYHALPEAIATDVFCEPLDASGRGELLRIAQTPKSPRLQARCLRSTDWRRSCNRLRMAYKSSDLSDNQRFPNVDRIAIGQPLPHRWRLLRTKRASPFAPLLERMGDHCVSGTLIVR